MSFYSYNEGTSIVKVTFKNEATGEFIFYNFELEASPPPLQGVISLECPVRSKATKTVTIKNPLPQDIVVTASAQNSQVNGFHA